MPFFNIKSANSIDANNSELTANNLGQSGFNSSVTGSASNSIIQLSPAQAKQVSGGDPSGKEGEIEVKD
jgi:hypothetical protein